MNSRERVLAVLEGRKPDRVPVVPQVGDHAGWIEGMTFDVIYHDAEKIADAHIKAYEKYGYDILAIQVEPSWPVAESCGCKVTYPADKCPWITENIIRKPEDVDKVQVPDFWAHPATGTILEATRKLSEKLGSEAMISGYMTGPLTFALQLVPYNDFIMATRKNPAFVEAVVRKATEVAVGFAHAYKEAGAEMYVICEHDLQMFSPKTGMETIVANLPQLTEVMAYNMLHVCGNVAQQLQVMAEGLCEVPRLQFINFSHDVSIDEMVGIFGDRMGLCGNIDHIHLLSGGTREEIMEACKNAISSGKKAKAFMLGPGCEITTDTPEANVKAFVESASRYGGF